LRATFFAGFSSPVRLLGGAFLTPTTRVTMRPAGAAPSSRCLRVAIAPPIRLQRAFFAATFLTGAAFAGASWPPLLAAVFFAGARLGGFTSRVSCS